jgi:eukaryotic-like serine/threonine-protein kinase
VLSKLTHANVVRVYEANTFNYNDKRFCYIGMEYVKGGTLATYLEQAVRLPLDKAIKIQKDICAGLSVLHEKDPPLIHRDVKPQNIMISTDNHFIAKISDFGLAKHVDPLTRVTEAAGTLAYLPPEGFWDYETPASDVFSAGMIFYITLTGVSPFKMPSGYHSTKKSEIRAAVIASRNKKPTPPSKYNLELDEELDEIVLKAVDPEIKNRYRDAGEFLKAIERYEYRKFILPEEEIYKALEFGKQYSNLKKAIALLEDAIMKYPKEKRDELKQKYKSVLSNWKKGVAM